MSYTIEYDVPGDIPIIAQPSDMSCWATVATMNISWYNQQSYSIETAMDNIGPEYRKIYDDNSGLNPAKVEDFSNASGLNLEYQSCETPESILRLLINHGPLIIIDDEDSSSSFALHARIIRGIYGGGNPDDTYVKIIDPWEGQTYDEVFSTFAQKYEEAAGVSDLTIQMMHF
jgi:hypothetical protein